LDEREFLARFEEALGAEPGRIRGDEPLSELPGWDSLAVVAFIAMADSQYGAALPPKRIAAARTVADLKALLEQSLPGAGG